MDSLSGIPLQSIFQLSAEIPPMPRTYKWYRWWEDEATTIFWAFDVKEISRVIRFGLFQDPGFPRESLCLRNSGSIDMFLAALLTSGEIGHVQYLTHVEKVEAILNRLSIQDPSQGTLWSWVPPEPNDILEVLEIADAIEAESHFHFKQIHFEDLVRAALGYNASSVEWFLQQHTALYIVLLRHFKAHPQSIPLYEEVETELRLRSPFAHRALARSLSDFQPADTRIVPQLSTLGFEFIAEGIQGLFRDEPGMLSEKLKTLSVLAYRFRRQYVEATTMDWNTPFETSVPFLEDIFTYSSSMDLARSVTVLDEHGFAEIQTLSAPDAAVDNMLLRWDTLSESVWECSCALPELIKLLEECAQNLFEKRNYHFLMALINGLRRYMDFAINANNILTYPKVVIPENIISLTNPDKNFYTYRQHYQKFPGIPYLTPHLRDAEQYGVSVLQPVDQFLCDLQRNHRVDLHDDDDH